MDAEPTEEPPQLAGESVRLDAQAFGQSSITQAGRDVHLHYEDGVRRAGTADPGGGVSLSGVGVVRAWRGSMVLRPR
jgi:hypothetical protein